MNVMDERIEELLTENGLERLSAPIHDAALPAIGLSFEKVWRNQTTVTSKLGGQANLPADFAWPTNKSRPLDFLLQINLSELQPYNSQGLLPTSGLLSFFYDLEDQPWGYDPDDLDGFCVVYTPIIENLERRESIVIENSPAERSIRFHSVITFPHSGSRAFDWLVGTSRMNQEDEDAYIDLSAQVEDLYSSVSYNPTFVKTGGYHRSLGHSLNIQGDMQLQAQLVTNGLYCGNSSGYSDPRRQALEAGAEDWILLLQLDSDDSAQLKWGDLGILYFWIHKQDLAQQHFDNVWMTVQCG